VYEYNLAYFVKTVHATAIFKLPRTAPACCVAPQPRNVGKTNKDHHILAYTCHSVKTKCTLNFQLIDMLCAIRATLQVSPCHGDCGMVSMALVIHLSYQWFALY